MGLRKVSDAEYVVYYIADKARYTQTLRKLDNDLWIWDDDTDRFGIVQRYTPPAEELGLIDSLGEKGRALASRILSDMTDAASRSPGIAGLMREHGGVAAAQSENTLKALMVDLLELAKTDAEAKAIVSKYNIKYTPPAEDKAVSPASSTGGGDFVN